MHCLTDILFSLARRRCDIVENESVKEKRFKELKSNTLVEQKYPKLLIKASILRAKDIPLEVLRQPKTNQNEEIVPFTTTYNPNNLNVFPIITHGFDNFQYSKTMSNIFTKNELAKSMSEAPKLRMLLCRSKFESQYKNHELENCGKNCASCPYFLKASLHQSKRISRAFLLKNSLTVKAVI